MKTLATGAELSAETWNDFVSRLRHHCRGAGVEEHYTAAAIFTVQERRFIYGISDDYTDRLAIIFDDRVWHSVAEYVEDLDEDQLSELNDTAIQDGHESFACLDDTDKLEIIERQDGHSVTGWDDAWEHIGTHFTKEAADAFIARKGHDYPYGLRVYVEAQPYAWEFETIKNAIMDGIITFKEKP